MQTDKKILRVESALDLEMFYEQSKSEKMSNRRIQTIIIHLTAKCLIFDVLFFLVECYSLIIGIYFIEQHGMYFLKLCAETGC